MHSQVILLVYMLDFMLIYLKMDLRSKATIDHKKAEARTEREFADIKRDRARLCRSEARIKQRGSYE